MSYGIPIPDTAAQAFHRNKQRVHNLGLIFDRFAPDWREDPKLKGSGLNEIAKNLKPDPKLLSAWNRRWEVCARAANAEPFSLKTDWRFVAGLGRKGPLEVGFTFNRYGFPILPGSSVKGIARASALLLHDVEEDSKDFITIFGRAPEQREDQSFAQTGGAVFFDAIPTRVPKLEVDIMNPHFPNYYGVATSKVPPADWQNPRPVNFLTVAKDTEFRFAVGWRGVPNADLQGKAKEWLIAGLKELGAGAKTSAGYGYFSDTSEGTSSPASQLTQASSTSQKPAELPKGATQRGEGKLIRERSRTGEDICVQDGNLKLPVLPERLGKSEYNSLPGNNQPVTYEFDEVNGQRRVWRIQRKPKGF